LVTSVFVLANMCVHHPLYNFISSLQKMIVQETTATGAICCPSL